MPQNEIEFQRKECVLLPGERLDQAKFWPKLQSFAAPPDQAIQVTIVLTEVQVMPPQPQGVPP